MKLAQATARKGSSAANDDGSFTRRLSEGTLSLDLTNRVLFLSGYPHTFVCGCPGWSGKDTRTRRSPAFVVAVCILGCLIGRSAGEPSNIISLSNIPPDAEPPNRVGGFFLSCDSSFLRGPPVDFAFLCPTSPEEPDPDNSDGVSEAVLTIEIGDGFADSEGEDVVVRFLDEAERPVEYQVFLGADASIESETSIAPEDSPGFTVPVPAMASVTLVIETQVLQCAGDMGLTRLLCALCLCAHRMGSGF